MTKAQLVAKNKELATQNKQLSKQVKSIPTSYIKQEKVLREELTRQAHLLERTKADLRDKQKLNDAAYDELGKIRTTLADIKVKIKSFAGLPWYTRIFMDSTKILSYFK